MRITAGDFKGRVLGKMNWEGTKPTTDMVRQAVCSYLLSRLDLSNCSILDLYSGSGIVSLEFISRGAKSVCSVDYFKKCVVYCESLKSELQISDEVWCIEKAKVLKFLENPNTTYNIIWADPPYFAEEISKMVDTVLNGVFLKDNGIFVLEHRAGIVFRSERIVDTKKYGDTILSIYK